MAVYTRVIWRMNNRPVDGRSSETVSPLRDEQHEHLASHTVLLSSLLPGDDLLRSKLVVLVTG
jgi:hypothetical protein